MPVFRYALLCIPALCLAAIFAFGGCSDAPKDEVVVYVSVDRQHAEPVLVAYEKQTGVRVKAVYDVEAAKVTGLVNRLIQEREAPVADVFWNGEIVQTMRLKERGVLASYDCPATRSLSNTYRDPDGYWHGAGGRARVIIANTDRLDKGSMPSGLEDFLAPGTDPKTMGIAMPLFGTTATHAAALYAIWGPDRAEEFFSRLRDKGVLVVNGNSEVRDMVADGRMAWGLTDTDDAYGAVKRGAPVKIILPDQNGLGTLVIPYTVGLIKGGPNTEQGRWLIDYLVGTKAEAMLIRSGFSQLSAHGNPTPGRWEGIKTMDVTFEDTLRQMKTSHEDLRRIFLQ
ncbi:extracellular solute-binding protein [Pseudodesulfovibrio cashew]|uniref:Extracellular solute-binding protein n=1 Tax=Pseudodesulfovibrio cashew TaxID=2678688 RepID=A0A6I6J7A8_9BACT|nr:extracellular solute-binding protein [Pseudodesulfovibrio cashew]QGY38686.1 extracellular solute-binding protein [Pseudodesulfovibrio cashew]